MQQPCVLLCRNKSKFEYTLQGWKAFALSHSVRSGDRLQIELLPDGRRMRADIVKRASPKDRAMAMADPGPASPAVIDVASVAKPCSGEASVPEGKSCSEAHDDAERPWLGIPMCLMAQNVTCMPQWQLSQGFGASSSWDYEDCLFTRSNARQLEHDIGLCHRALVLCCR